jgi:hypothetical protein
MYPRGNRVCFFDNNNFHFLIYTRTIIQTFLY